MDIQEKKKNRYKFLEHIYTISNADTSEMYDMWYEGNQLNLEHSEIQRIVDYLIGENLIESKAMGGLISLTHYGIKEIEFAKDNPDEPTEHFLPINFINIGTMNNSTLQQGNHNSIVNNFDHSKLEHIQQIINSLNEVKDTLILSIDLQKELVSEIQTLESQTQSPKPKNIIILESLKSIRTILETVAANAATPLILSQISQILN